MSTFRAFLLISLAILAFVGCQTAAPTPAPIIPTTTAVPTPTLAAVKPTTPAATAAATVAPTPTIVPPTAVPTVNTDDLLAIAQTVLPPNAYDGLNVLPLTVPQGERPLWVVHSVGVRDYSDHVLSHFLAIYTIENGVWQRLAWLDLDNDSGDVYAAPDYLFEGGVAQVSLDDANIWLTVEGGVGAHGGTFQLLRFDGAALHIAAQASNASPGVGSLADLNDDGILEAVMGMHDYYVFCYACGVRYLNFQVFAWDAANQRMNEISLQPLPSSQQDNPAYQPANRAVQLAQADLWDDALAQVAEAQRLAAANPTGDATLDWDAALIRLYHDAWQAEQEQTPYPLLTRIFAGDYAGALDIMRGYANEQIFSADTPLIQDTVAEGFDQWVADYILGETDAAIAARPDLAAAYYLRAWAAFLQNPVNPQIQTDLAQAAALNPGEPLFIQVTPPTANRIQFAPGATSAEIAGQIEPQGIDVYVLRALAGQRMAVNLFSTDDSVQLQLQDSGGGWLDGQVTTTAWLGTLPETADTVIRVLGGDIAADYTLRVSIPARIQFAPGAISAAVQGDLNAYESDDYILAARAGQTMTVNITSANNDVLLTIVGADGVPLTNGLMSGATSWTGQLPVTQDYIVRALGTAQPANYTLDVTIE